MDPTNLPAPTKEYCERAPALYAIIVLSSTLFAVATVVVPLRVFVRLRILRIIWWDDICLIISYLLSVCSLSIIWYLISIGYGRRIGCFPVDRLLHLGRLSNINTTITGFGQLFSRMSVALFVIRLFAISHRLRIALYVYTIFMVLSIALTLLLIWGECRPVAAEWDPALLATAKCWSVPVRDFLGYYNGAVAVLSDVLLALLPTYFIRKLKATPRVRLALSALMAVGMIPAACALVRTILSATMIIGDISYDTGTLVVFAMLETLLLMIAAAAPALPPLFQKERRAVSERNYHYKNLLSGSIRRKIYSAGNSLSSSERKVAQASSSNIIKKTSITDSESSQHALRDSYDRVNSRPESGKSTEDKFKQAKPNSIQV